MVLHLSRGKIYTPAPQKTNENIHLKKYEYENKEPDKSNQPFDFEHELSKLKISIPMSKLPKNPSYMKQIEKDLNLNNPSNQYDTINLVDESPEIKVGPDVDE